LRPVVSGGSVRNLDVRRPVRRSEVRSLVYAFEVAGPEDLLLVFAWEEVVAFRSLLCGLRRIHPISNTLIQHEHFRIKDVQRSQVALVVRGQSRPGGDQPLGQVVSPEVLGELGSNDAIKSSFKTVSVTRCDSADEINVFLDLGFGRTGVPPR